MAVTQLCLCLKSGLSNESVMFFSLPFYKLVVPTVDTVRYSYLVSSLVSNCSPVMLVGPVGTGKTSVVQGVLSRLDPAAYNVLTVNLSAQVSLLLLLLPLLLPWEPAGFFSRGGHTYPLPSLHLPPLPLSFLLGPLPKSSCVLLLLLLPSPLLIKWRRYCDARRHAVTVCVCPPH